MIGDITNLYFRRALLVIVFPFVFIAGMILAMVSEAMVQVALVKQAW